jgi:hypothetical protein
LPRPTGPDDHEGVVARDADAGGITAVVALAWLKTRITFGG